ncbi:MAG: hypothetical protein IPJ98_24555 [Bryobacterales bacterium]|nr:hypothetical protein [Bryobacterales bacterium]
MPSFRLIWQHAIVLITAHPIADEWAPPPPPPKALTRFHRSSQRMHRLWQSFLLALAVGLLNHAAVIAGLLNPPPGYEPAWVLRNPDIPQYLTWAIAARSHWLLPNFHAPWVTEPALFQPMLQTIGKSGLPLLPAYYLQQALLYWAAAWALLAALETFCATSRQRLWAIIAAAGALPLKLIAWAVAQWAGLAFPLQIAFALGVIEYSYETADGFFRGGLSNSSTLTLGTAVSLSAFTLLARYLRSGEARHFHLLCLVNFVGALLHPFEVFLISTAAIFPLARARRWPQIAFLGLAGGLGILPYLIQTIRSPWLRDASDLAVWHMPSPAWVILTFGLPAFAVCWLTLVRPRSPEPEDDVLNSWFFTNALLPMIPGIPVANHLFDGFAYCCGFLLMRKAAADPMFTRYTRRLRPAAFAWAASTAAVLITLYAQLYRDGTNPDPFIGLPAIIASDERRLLDWMRTHTPEDALVLAPEPLAHWIAPLPRKSLGSHDVFSITYSAQREDAARFFAGDHAIIGKYGVGIAVSDRPLPGLSPIHIEGRWHVYEFPGRQPHPYPGRSSLPGAPKRSLLRQWLFTLFSAP